MDGTYKIKNHKVQSTIKTFSAIHKDGAYEMFYAGTKKGKQMVFSDVMTKKKNRFKITDSDFKKPKIIDPNSLLCFRCLKSYFGCISIQFTESYKYSPSLIHFLATPHSHLLSLKLNQHTNNDEQKRFVSLAKDSLQKN